MKKIWIGFLSVMMMVVWGCGTENNDATARISSFTAEPSEVAPGGSAVLTVKVVKAASESTGEATGEADDGDDDKAPPNAWGVDVTVACSQKGLMLPPGLGINALSDKAVQAARHARLPRAYWDWAAMLRDNAAGFFPYTPATNLLFGLREALALLEAEGLKAVTERHARLGAATRRAVAAWGLETVCQDPAAHSNTLTGILLPPGHDADALRALLLDRFDLALGAGLGKLQGRAFGIGHLGDLNDLTLLGTLCGVEMGLAAAGLPHTPGGVAAAMELLRSA